MKHIPMFTGEPRELENKQMSTGILPLCRFVSLHVDMQRFTMPRNLMPVVRKHVLKTVQIICYVCVISLFNESVFIVRTESQLYFQKVTF